MKNKNVMIYSLGLLLCAAVCSCQDDPTADDGGDNWTGGGEVKFSLSTRAGDSEVTTTFADGTNIGIVPSDDDAKNYCYSYNNGDFSAVTDKILWESNVVEMSVEAFYPYNKSGYSSLSVKADQSVADDYFLSDALHAKGNTTRQDNNLELTFHHVMSKLVLNITQLNEENITSIRIGENNLPLSATSFTYEDDGSVNSVGSLGTENATISACPSAGNNLLWRAIIIPQTATLKVFITTSVDGKAKTYTTTLATSQQYVSGYQYTYSFKMVNAQLIVTSEIQPWTKNQTDGEAIM